VTDIQKDVVSYGAGFGMMLTTSAASYAIPIPMLREILTDHFAAVVVWTLCTCVGWLVTIYIRKRLK
jgi:hypothetical protein